MWASSRPAKTRFDTLAKDRYSKRYSDTQFFRSLPTPLNNAIFSITLKGMVIHHHETLAKTALQHFSGSAAALAVKAIYPDSFLNNLQFTQAAQGLRVTLPVEKRATADLGITVKVTFA